MRVVVDNSSKKPDIYYFAMDFTHKGKKGWDDITTLYMVSFMRRALFVDFSGVRFNEAGKERFTGDKNVGTLESLANDLESARINGLVLQSNDYPDGYESFTKILLQQYAAVTKTKIYPINFIRQLSGNELLKLRERRGIFFPHKEGMLFVNSSPKQSKYNT